MTTSRSSPRFIARQLSVGFGSVAIVAIAMCVMLVGVIDQVSGLVDGMRHDEMSIREGRQLATSVRELSLHVAHTVIEGDDTHLEHYSEWRTRVSSHIAQLRAHGPARIHAQLDALSVTTEEIDSLLHSTVLPAARAGNTVALRHVQHELESLGERAARDADEIASATVSEMAHAHDLATSQTRLGLLGGALCVFLIMGLSIGFTMRLRASVLKPLLALTDAAHRFGQGAFETRVGSIGRGELQTVAQAFDAMADELTLRETSMLRNERMAAIGQLAAGVAHELNNPIGIIRGYLRTMTPDGDPVVLGEELAILDEEARQCQRIAHDLVSYSRSGELQIETVNMGELFAVETARFAETPQGQGRSIETSAVDHPVELDRGRVGQVLLNLLSNASEASPTNTPIQIRGTRNGDEYRIEVEDRGPGVEVADRERIFEPFFSKRRGGTGLGLAVCHGIVKAHGGTIEVIDGTDDGSGAIFRVLIPLTPAPGAGHTGRLSV